MNIWITKNIRFGYKYTSDRNVRNQILDSTSWLIGNIKQKRKESDVFILSGGLFYNTNPSIVAINDARNFINELKKHISVCLVNTSKDTRLFENVYYSTLDLFEGVDIIKNVTVINNVTVIPFQKTFVGENILQSDLGLFNGDKIPNLMQIDESEDKPGVFVFNTDRNKYIFMENQVSPKHKKYIINTIEELRTLSKSDIDKINSHLIINKLLIDDYKTELDILVHKISPVSVKYTGETKDYDGSDIVDITNNLSIDDTIIEHIKYDEDLKKQFERIQQIMNTKNNIEI